MYSPETVRLMAELDAGRLEHLPEVVRRLRRHNASEALDAIKARFLHPIVHAITARVEQLEVRGGWRRAALEDTTEGLRRMLEAGFDEAGVYATALLGQGGHAVVVAATLEGGARVAWKLPFGLTALLRFEDLTLPMPLQIIGGVTLTPHIGGLEPRDASGVLERSAAWQRALTDEAPLARLLSTIEVAGQPSLLFERLPGPSLRAALPLNAERALSTSRVLEEEGRAGVWRRLDALARALRLLHVQGAHHGDVKPEHVFFDDDGEARLIDPLPPRAAPRLGRDPGTSWIGSPGYTLLTPVEAPEMRDLLGAAAIGLELFGVEPGWREILFMAAARPGFRMFGLGDLESRYTQATASLDHPDVPEAFADWTRDTLHAVGIAPSVSGGPGPDAAWRVSMLERLRVIASARGDLSAVEPTALAGLPSWPP